MKKKACSLKAMGAAALAVLIATAGISPGAANSTPSLKPVRIGVFGTVCESPIFIAYEKGLFKEQGLEVELVQGNYQTLKDALATGKIDATDGLLMQWFKPIEQGIDVKFTAGIHTGCIQVVVPKESPIKSAKDLAGKAVGVNSIGGGTMNFGLRILSQEGIDGKANVTWKVFPNAELPLALKKGDVDAIIIGDPFAEIAIESLPGRSILNSALQSPYKEEYCCLVVVNGKLIREDPATAAAITQSILNGARWVKANTAEAAKIAAEKKHVPGNAELNAKILATYNYEPSVDGGEKALYGAGAELKRTGILDPGTDVEALAKASFVRLPGVK